MLDDFSQAMRRALDSVRASNLGEATAQIQDALQGKRATKTAGARPANQTRKSLGETLAALSARRKPAPRVPEPALPEGAAFLRQRHDTPQGGRDYRLYVPGKVKARGLIVMLHGCTQNAEDFATGTMMNAVAEEEGFLVAYPTQARQYNSSGCWNWFEPRHQRRAEGEPHIIADMTRAIIAEYGLDEAHAFVAGMSAGGAMAAVMAAAYPDLFKAAGIHSGLPYQSAHDVNSALAAMRGHRMTQAKRAASAHMPRLIIFHGSKDHTVSSQNAALLLDEARQQQPALQVRQRRFLAGTRQVEHTQLVGSDGIARAESFIIDGAGHQWSGGNPAGSHTEAKGPDASRQMMRFFLKRPLGL
jgi:poly(hydroxyalkanoate) depolymerase family esterase